MDAFKGLSDLLVYLVTWFFTDFDLRTINTAIGPKLMTAFSGILNPLFALSSEFLGEWFGF